MAEQSIFPFASSLLQSTKKMRTSFHALPITKGGALMDSRFRDIYDEILGSSLEREASFGLPFVDSLANPRGPLLEAERLAAVAFGADRTLFTSCGTSLSNEIAIRALIYEPNMKVLADRGLHQSVHFALRDRSAKVQYLRDIGINRHDDRRAIDPDHLVEVLTNAERLGDPVKCLAINGQSYDGLIQNVTNIAQIAIEACPSLQSIFVDEAWGAANYFHPSTAHLTAMAAAKLNEQSNVTFVSTQSAHKALCALRQGSFIQIFGAPKVIKRMEDARYRFHTTSPSLPILASLDLARAQMVSEGEPLVSRANRLAQQTRNSLECDKTLTEFSALEVDMSEPHQNFAVIDTKKLLIRSSNPHLSGQRMQRRLFESHGIFTGRCNKSYALFNFHIGISASDVEHLLCSLHALSLDEANEDIGHLDGVADCYVIPYPPGVPLIFPGDSIDDHARERIAHAKESGASLMKVET